MSGPFKLKYNNSSFPFKSPLKDTRPVRLTSPPQEHYHEDGEVKWRTVDQKEIKPPTKGPAPAELPEGETVKDWLKPL